MLFKDVTLLMDKYGNAMLINDKGATSNFMVIGNYYQALVGNKVCTFVHGWDIGGEEVDLNLGSNVKIENHGNSKSVYGHVIGELVYYTSDGTNGDADYKKLFSIYSTTQECDIIVGQKIVGQKGVETDEKKLSK